MDLNKITFKEHLSEFYPVVRKRVDKYFIQHGISKFANSKMVIIAIFILLMYVASYGLLLSNTLAPFTLFIVCGIHGFFTAQIGLNIGHDAIHGAYSSNNKINKRISILFNIVGANDYIWSITHNILHHTFTNIPGHDDDINQPKILRVNLNNKLLAIHKFQHLYAFLLYPLASISWVFVKDYVKFFSSKLSNRKNKKHPTLQYYRLFFYKILYLILFLVVPLMFIDHPWYYILLGFLVVHVVEGLTLALVFQLAHLVEKTQFPEPCKEGTIVNSWAVHQLYTTADFSRNSWAANVLCGGLNFQIEHHLFPKICHIHYKDISPIVKRTAEEFGIPFIENKTFLEAMISHVKLLKKLGRERYLMLILALISVI